MNIDVSISRNLSSKTGSCDLEANKSKVRYALGKLSTQDACGVILTPICRPGSQEHKYLSPKASRFKTSLFEDRKYPVSQLKGRQAGGICSYSGEKSAFYLTQTFTIWKRLIHIREGNFTQSIILTIKLISKHPNRNI